MFGFFRNKRRNQAMFESLMQAAAEGSERAKINQGFGYLGINPPNTDDNTHYCSEMSASFVKMIMKDSGGSLSQPDEDTIFAGGVYLLTVCDYVSQRVGAPFEEVFLLSFLTLFENYGSPDEISEYVTPVTNTFNNAAQNTNAIKALGENLVQFIQNPSREKYDKLISFYEIFRKHMK